MDPFVMEDFFNQRNINIRYKFDQNHMLVLSHMQDDYHDISLFFRVESNSREVEEVQGKMNSNPFEDCPFSLNILKKMVGLKIAPGVKKSYFSRFEKKMGCTHVTELMFATFDFIFARLYGTKKLKTEEERNQMRRLGAEIMCQNNNCIVYNRDNLKNFDNKGRYKGKGYEY